MILIFLCFIGRFSSRFMNFYICILDNKINLFLNSENDSVNINFNLYFRKNKKGLQFN